MKILDKTFEEIKGTIKLEELETFRQYRKNKFIENENNRLKGEIARNKIFDSIVEIIKNKSETIMILNSVDIQDILEHSQNRGYENFRDVDILSNEVIFCGTLKINPKRNILVYSSNALGLHEMDLFMDENDPELKERYPSLHLVIGNPPTNLVVNFPKEADIAKSNGKVVRIIRWGNDKWYRGKINCLFEVIPDIENSNMPYIVISDNESGYYSVIFKIKKQDCEVVKDVAPVKTNSRYDLIRRK
jgi:hypothetical protein